MPKLIEFLESGVIDSSGNPLASGKAYIYQVGTTTPVDSWSDAALSSLNTNPVILSSVGKAEVYINQDVRVLIKTAADVTVDDIDALGTSTSLTGTTTIGASSSDTLVLNALVQGDLIPTVDNTYNIGSAAKRWANLYANFQGSILQAGFVNNLGLSLSAGTVTINDATGSTLSSTNPASVTMNSTTAGRLVNLKITSPLTFNDDSHASSDFTNLPFGINGTADYAQDVPFFIYMVNKSNTDCNGSDGNSALMVARLPHLLTTPSSSTNIGSTTTPPANDGVSSDSQTVVMLLGNYTVANYTSLNCQLIGCFRMRWLTSTDDWTVQTLGSTDGFGSAILDRMFNTSFTFPAGQGGGAAGYFAQSGTYGINTNGPVFSTNTYKYSIDKFGSVVVNFYLNGDGGTDGSGGSQYRVALPYLEENQLYNYGVGDLTVAAGTRYRVVLSTQTQSVDFSVTDVTSSFVLNSDFPNGTRTIRGTITYFAKR